jgi:hypothetical protein
LAAGAHGDPWCSHDSWSAVAAVTQSGSRTLQVRDRTRTVSRPLERARAIRCSRFGGGTVCLIEDVATGIANVGAYLVDLSELISNWVLTPFLWWPLCRLFGQGLLKTVDICVVVFKHPTPSDSNHYTATHADVRADVNNADWIWSQCKVHIKWDGDLIQIDDAPDLGVAQFECPVDVGGVASGTINDQLWAYRGLVSSLSLDGCKRLGWIGPIPFSTPKLFVFYVDAVLVLHLRDGDELTTLAAD